MTRQKHGAEAAERKAWHPATMAAEQEGVLQVLIRRMLEEGMEAEMNEVVGAEKGQRTASRTGYRSGYFRRTLVTRVGKIGLRVPQDREGRFQTEVSERHQRSEKALVVRMFPNAASCLRLVRALAVEIHEDWIEATRYLDMDLLQDQEKSRPRLGGGGLSFAKLLRAAPFAARANRQPRSTMAH